MDAKICFAASSIAARVSSDAGPSSDSSEPSDSSPDSSDSPEPSEPSPDSPSPDSPSPDSSSDSSGGRFSFNASSMILNISQNNSLIAMYLSYESSFTLALSIFFISDFRISTSSADISSAFIMPYVAYTKQRFILILALLLPAAFSSS